MSNTAWAHLPNAKHISAVLADVRKRTKAWDAAWNAARDAVWYVAQDAAWGAAQNAAQNAARNSAQNAAWGAALNAAGDAAWYVAQDAVIALIAWDSSAGLLDCTPDVLRTMVDLAEPPVCHQAALLLPYAIVRSNAKQEVT